MGTPTSGLAVGETIFRKTWKREAAAGLLIWLVLAITGVLFADLKQGVELVRSAIVPVMGLATALFGVQVYQNVAAATYGARTTTTPSKPTEAANVGNHPFRPDAVEDH